MAKGHVGDPEVEKSGSNSSHTHSGPVRGRAPLVLAALVVTFVAVRAMLHANPYSNFDVFGYNVHHLFTGLLLLVAGGVPLALRHERSWTMDACALLFGAGLALCLDEWVYLIVTDGSDNSYVLPVSLWGGVVMVTLGVCYVAGVWFFSTKNKSDSDTADSRHPQA